MPENRVPESGAPEASVTVRLDQRLSAVFAGVGAVLGFILAFLVGPVVDWLIDRVDGAPVPLRLVSELPLVWAVGLLTVLGFVGGWLLFAIWSDEVSEVTVSEEGVLITHGKSRLRVDRPEVDQVFLDKDELVLVDSRARELVRTGSDSSVAKKLESSFEDFGYTWAGVEDPRDAEFTAWTDRSAELDDAAHAALRRRRRALADGKPGAAEEAREELAEMGIVVRDRGEEQQYRWSG